MSAGQMDEHNVGVHTVDDLVPAIHRGEKHERR